MSDPKLAWQTGTIKVRSNDKDSHVSGSIEDLFDGVEEERDKYKKALDAIKKHVELSCPSGHKMSAVWNIANEGLK